MDLEKAGPVVLKELASLNVTEKSSQDPQTAPVPVVGIGASAGGLEVFKRLLGHLPVDTGLGIVFIQHLDPSHQSMLTEILARATSMPVSQATNGMGVEANHVYVMPARVDLTIAQGVLNLAPRTQTAGSHMPIDGFLRSLAREGGSRGIGVILSGSGSDGSAGVEAIKGAGGVTFAQDPAGAKFAIMPQAAIATGSVDFVLSPEGIAAELVRICRHPYIVDSMQGTPPAEDARIADILTILHGATGVDFSLYREKMIKRRILRRLALCKIDTLAEYAELLVNNADELAALQRDLLISVTSFFRDPEAFEYLKKTVFPRILQGRSANQTIRIWVAGCATGEEAFSMAILLQECMSEADALFPVQIFASDISLEAIEKARTGRYRENIAADVTPERLNRYFTKIDEGYQINKNLREMCVFTRHNLLDDPPFSRLDLISCRNVLIYLGSVQKNILPLFHYALKPAGFLMLGASERAASSDLFSALDGESRFYARRLTIRKPQPFHTAGRGSEGNVPAGGNLASTATELWSTGNARKEVDRILLSKYSLAGAVVDDDLEVIEIRGKASPYLTLPAGKVSFNLMKLIPDTALFLEVEKLIQQARSSGEPARLEDVPYEHGGGTGSLNLEAVPLDANRKHSVLVLFEPVPEFAAIKAGLPGAVNEGDTRGARQIARLKQQLTDAKERFLSAIEAHQTSREESQSTTEEALSANEELQSLNEELETAKEELQSTNEELVTVNDELQAKNTALAEARDFAMSIVETVRQPLLVLDAELRIRMANRAFYRTFQLSAQEAEGQLIYSIARGSWDFPGLRNSIEALLLGNSFPDFEVEKDFPGVGRRSLVFGGCRINHLKMVLLAVDDITESKAAEQALRQSEEHLRQSQKMEAVGRLAGGIAHDFNNLLTGIIGYSAMLQDTLAGNEQAFQQVQEIRSAGERAASLTQQLLAFSRRQVLQPKVLDLNVIVAEFDSMLRRLVGERIKVRVDCDPALWQVRADPGEIGRAIMNLSLNARDAMPDGGTLSIETANVTLTEVEAGAHDLAAGDYVTLVVRDTGIGMTPEMQAHIFEPFFTTKEAAKGTGLGLATVLGIVEQSGGAIHAQSDPGRGTAFAIFLPAITATAAPKADSIARLAQASRGSETILLVEDEDVVRTLTRMILEKSGYVVFEARNGREGLTFCETYQGPIDLLLSDVVMPELGGRELAEGALKLRPGVKIMFMSGHTQDVVLREGIQRGTAFLQKPFTPLGLTQKVRETLDGGADAAANR